MTAVVEPGVVERRRAEAFAEMARREALFDASRPACPDWCNGECSGVGHTGDAVMHRSAETDAATSPATTDPGNGTVEIRVTRYESLGALPENRVELDLTLARGLFEETVEFTPALARRFAAEVVRHADLLEPEQEVPAEQVRVGDWFPVDDDWQYVYQVDVDAYADVVQISTTVDREEYPEIGCGKDEEPHAFDFGETVRIRREFTPLPTAGGTK